MRNAETEELESVLFKWFCSAARESAGGPITKAKANSFMER
jgi:hypothetical protein